MIYVSKGGYGCSKEQFTCQNKKCIEQYFRCDGNDDCGDGSDETDGCRGNIGSYKITLNHKIEQNIETHE